MVTPKSKWGIAAFALIAAFAFLAILNWQRFPLFLDIYYHLNVMHGFDRAGGVTAHAFWELAPEGTINLYPPLFHILLLAVYKLGANTLFIARFFSILPFFLLLLSLYFVIGRLFSKRLGFFVVMAACLPYTFFLKSTITIPSTFALTLLILTFYAIEKKRAASAILLLSASFYMHLALPWLGVLALLIYGLLKKGAARVTLFTIIAAVLLAAPILYHQFTNLDKFENIAGIRVGENELLEIYPLLYAFAVMGLLRLKEEPVRGRGLFFIALFIGLLPMAINYRYRLISAEGLLPIIFFAGLGLEKVYLVLDKSLGKITSDPRMVTACLFSSFIIANGFFPSISVNATSKSTPEERKPKIYLMDSTAANLLPEFKQHLRPMELNLYDIEAEDWVKTINNNTASDDIICSNYTYIGSMLSAISGRANAARLFYEIKEPQRPVNEFASSKLAIWMREISGEYDSKSLDIAYNKYGFKKISETEKAVILVRDDTLKAMPSKPVVKTWQAFLILAASVFFVSLDLSRPEKA